MRKLFLLSLPLALLCMWAVAGADNSPSNPESPATNVIDRAERIAAEQPISISVSEQAQEVEAVAPQEAPSTASQGPAVIKKQEEAPVEEIRITAEDELRMGKPGRPAEEPLQLPSDAATNLLQAPLPPAPVKAPYTGPKNIPVEGVILQGGDDIANATPIPSLPYSDVGTTSGYTDDYDEACPYTGSTSPDVVYSYTPAQNEEVTISLCTNSCYDTKLYVYENVETPGNPYACNDDACSTPCFPSPYVSELVCVPLIAGNTYYIVVDGYGGDFGDYTIDVTVCQPEPTPCDNALYHNGEPDCVNGLACERRLDNTLTVWTVDDATFVTDVVVNDLHWWAIDTGADWVNLADIIIMTDAGCAPADTVWMENDIPSTRLDSGYNCFGLPTWLYSIDGLVIPLTAGTYWFGMRPVNAGPSGQSFWATTPANASCPDVYFQSDDFGYPDWTPGVQVFGVEYNVAFCVTGEAGAEPTGACCDDLTGICQDDVLFSDCPPPLRFAANTLCADLVPPCGTITGACCDPATGDCVEVTQADCIAMGWDYQGDFTDCTPNPCPIPPPPNDSCQNRIPVAVPSSTMGTNINATIDDTFPSPCGTSITSPGVWYSVIGTGNTITATTCNAGSDQDFDSKISVYCNTCEDPICVDGNDDNCSGYYTFLSSVSWCSEPGVEYLILVHSFGGDEGNFQLDVFDDGIPCQDPPVCEHLPCIPDFSVAAPGQWTGNTCGAGNDCDLRASEEHIYEVVIPNDGEWTFSLCGSSYDTYLYVGTTCCGQEVGFNDDFCGLQSELTANITAGTYYVAVEAWSSTGCGDYVLTISQPEPCIVDCPPGGYPEGEPVCADEYEDTYNGGCNSTPPVFQDVAAGDTICAESGTFFFGGSSYRDTDWFRLTLDSDGTITWKVVAEFEVLIFVIDAGSENCADYTILGNTTAPECDTAVLSFAVPAGVYWLWAGPTVFGTGVPCGSKYTGIVEVTGPPLGACCVNEECVATNTQSECDALGGSWFEGETCPEFQCPVDPCADAIYHNGTPDCVNGTASERRLDGSLTVWSADDATFDADVTINDLHWWTIDTGADWVGMDDIIIMSELGCAPADTVFMASDVPNTRVLTDYNCFGLPTYLYSVDGLSIPVTAGIYFIGLRPVTAGPSGQSFWATSPPSGCDMFFQSDDFGYPDWTPGQDVFGAWYNLAFCVTSQVEVLGACCDDATGDCVDDVLGSDCPPPLRFTPETLCADIYPPCGVPAGACCVDNNCIGDLTEEDCLAQGGTWYEGESCATFTCPFLGCVDALYHNGEPDCVNGTASERRLDQTLTVWSVDDATFAEDVTVTDIHWWGIDTGADWVDLADVIILNEANCAPTDTVADLTDQPATRFDSGYNCFGLPTWLYTVDGLSVDLAAGIYFIGARPVNAGPSGQNFHATSPPTGCDMFFQSDDFGFPDYTPGFDVFGAFYNLAFCVTGTAGPAGCDYICGDVNGNGAVNVVDITALVLYLTAGQEPGCPCDCLDNPPFYACADVNGNCAINVVDITALVLYLTAGQLPSTCVDCPSTNPCPIGLTLPEDDGAPTLITPNKVKAVKRGN